MDGFVSQPLDLAALVGRTPSRPMKTMARIDNLVGQFAGAAAAHEQFQQTQQHGQAMALEISRLKRARLRASRCAPKAARNPVSRRAAQRIVSVGRNQYDEAGRLQRIGEPETQAPAGIVDHQVATSRILLICKDRAERIWVDRGC